MIDFTYYSTVFLGRELTEEDFPYFSRQAERYINFVTSGRYRDVCEEHLEAVQNCICELAELEQTLNKLETKIDSGELISSESVGSYSVSYVTPETTGKTQAEKERYSIVKKYLAATGLLYRGVR